MNSIVHILVKNILLLNIMFNEHSTHKLTEYLAMEFSHGINEVPISIEYKQPAVYTET